MFTKIYNKSMAYRKEIIQHYKVVFISCTTPPRYWHINSQAFPFRGSYPFLSGIKGSGLGSNRMGP